MVEEPEDCDDGNSTHRTEQFSSSGKHSIANSMTYKRRFMNGTRFILPVPALGRIFLEPIHMHIIVEFAGKQTFLINQISLHICGSFVLTMSGGPSLSYWYRRYSMMSCSVHVLAVPLTWAS